MSPVIAQLEISLTFYAIIDWKKTTAFKGFQPYLTISSRKRQNYPQEGECKTDEFITLNDSI
jgi:hypothetical protein